MFRTVPASMPSQLNGHLATHRNGAEFARTATKIATGKIVSNVKHRCSPSQLEIINETVATQSSCQAGTGHVPPSSSVSLARPSTLPGSALGKFGVRRGEVGPVLLVAVPLNLLANVVKQVFRSLAAEPVADTAVRVPHGARHAHVHAWRVICHDPSFCAATGIVRRNLLVWPHSFEILCGHKVLLTADTAGRRYPARQRRP
jgi:hypothetical protein